MLCGFPDLSVLFLRHKDANYLLAGFNMLLTNRLSVWEFYFSVNLKKFLDAVVT